MLLYPYKAKRRAFIRSIYNSISVSETVLFVIPFIKVILVKDTVSIPADETVSIT